MPEVYAYKLFAPPANPEAVPRRGLVERAFANAWGRVVFLHGPAGHGKSTLLQQFKAECETRGWLSTWLCFDEADNDPRRFALHLQAAVAALGADGAVEAPEDDERPPARRQRVDRLLEQLFRLQRPVALCFDDFHTLHGGFALDFFRGLLERMPDNVRVFIASRSEPEIGLARLVINGRALILRAADLRFSPEEAAALFAGAEELGIRRDEVGAIYARTEGWPAALQLFRLALLSPGVRGALAQVESYRPRELAEYLVDNVLSLQPPEVQDFLLRSSLLARLNAPLCAAVTGVADAAAMLRRIERAGLFLVPVAGDGQWFKYNALFASCLAEQFRAQSPAQVDEVHRRAAEWCLAAGAHEEAVHHLLAGGETERAADAMTPWAARLIAGAHLDSVERWYDRLPFAAVAARPELAIRVAYALVFLRRQDKLRPLLPVLEARANDAGAAIVLAMAALSADDFAGAFQRIAAIGIDGHDAAGFEAFELSAAANLRGYRALAEGDFLVATEQLAHACAYSRRGNAAFSGGYTVGLLGMQLMMQGELGAAVERLRKGMSDERMQLEGSFALAALVSCYVWALYEANELDRVEALFAQYHELIADAVLPDFLAIAYLPMARTHDARGRPQAAIELLDEAEKIAHNNGWARLQRLVQWERVRRALLSGDVERARLLALGIAATPVTERLRLLPDDLEGEGLGRIRLAVHAGDAHADEWLAGELCQQRGRVHRQIRVNLFDAMRQQLRGRGNAARRSLRTALQLAQPGGYLRCFVDEGETVLQLLREEYRLLMQGSAPASAQLDGYRLFIEQILQAFGTDLQRSSAVVYKAPEALTGREREILAFLANGASNRELAERVFVSENTVKFHLRNIYQKLSVSTRSQAVGTARELGLIH